MAGISTAKVIGIPRLRFDGGMLHLDWQVELERALMVGSNHQASALLYQLRMTHRSSHFQILEQPDQELLSRVADCNRMALDRMPCLVSLPFKEMRRDLPWLKNSGWLHAPRQLSREYLWQFMCWGARYHHPEKDPAQVIQHEMCQMGGYFGIISLRDSQRLIDRFSPEADSAGWRLPRPDAGGRMICLNTGKSQSSRRILCVEESSGTWNAWGLGEVNPEYYGLRIAPLDSFSDAGRLAGRIYSYLHRGKRWYNNRKAYVDPLASQVMPYGTKCHDAHLMGVVEVGRLNRDLAYIHHGDSLADTDSPERIIQGTGSIDYSQPEVVASRSKIYGLLGDSQDPRIDLANYSLRHYPCQMPGWISRSVCSRVEKSPVCHSGRLEAITCQTLPSGLLNPQMPPQPSRLHGRIGTVSLYQPLNPFCSGATG